MIYLRIARYPLSILTLAGMPLLAIATNEKGNVQPLDTITVEGVQASGYVDNAGISDIKKTSEDLSKDQVIGIRDLLRYDPGISVNESGGRGTSSGYAMRGVDRDRIAVTVDGMAQAQTFQRQGFGMLGPGQGRSSGAQNEIEFENLKAIDVAQGSNSVLAGSGALGGAVVMQTKEVDDFIFSARNWGLSSKTSYSSKDGRTGQTFGLGGRTESLEGFVQNTVRKGHEIRAHKDIYRHGSGEIRRYRLDGTGIESETLSAKDISGPDRRTPNPMKYDSDSWLSRLGYHLTPEHYAGVVHEQTRQRYDIREMFERNYWSNLDEASIYRPSGNSAEFRFIPSRYYNDRHQYGRTGLVYRFRPQNAEQWTDSLQVRLDKQTVTLDSTVRTLNCSPYPLPDPNCTSTPGNIGSRSHFLQTQYTQTLTRFDITSNTSFKLGLPHEFWLSTGLNSGKTFITDRDTSKHAHLELDSASGVIHEHFSHMELAYKSPPIKSRNFFLAAHDTIQLGERWLLGLGGRYDHTAFDAAPDIFDDQHRSNRWSGQTGLHDSSHANFSWNLGLVLHLTPEIDLTYKTASGFRVPTVGELLGPSFNRRQERLPQPALKTEKSLTHELGLAVENSYGTAHASYFFSHYKNLIDIGLPKPHMGYPEGHVMYYNLQSVKTKGLMLKSQLDLHRIWPRLPDGLEALFALSYVKQHGNAPRNADFQNSGSYALDMLQPLRIVYGLEYISPNDGWGMAIKTTYSGPKKLDELTSESMTGGFKYIGGSKTAIRTPKWMVTDVTGFYRFNDHTTLRLGAYNVFNYRYISWESARQASFEPIGNSVLNTSYLALAAPGRNYTLNLEIKY